MSAKKNPKKAEHLTCETWGWNSCSHCFQREESELVGSVQYNLQSNRKKGIRATLRKANTDVLKPGKCNFTVFFQNQELSNAFSNIYSRFKHLRAILDEITNNYSVETNTRAVSPHYGWITRLLSCHVVVSVKMLLFYLFLVMLVILFLSWHNLFIFLSDHLHTVLRHRNMPSLVINEKSLRMNSTWYDTGIIFTLYFPSPNKM